MQDRLFETNLEVFDPSELEIFWSKAVHLARQFCFSLRLQFGAFGFLPAAFILNLRSSDLKQCIQPGSFASVLKFSFAALVSLVYFFYFSAFSFVH